MSGLTVHLASGEVAPQSSVACGEPKPVVGYNLAVEEIHSVTCEACKRLFREAVSVGKANAAVRTSEAFVAKQVALAVARTQLEQVEDLQEQAREKLEAVAKLPPELAKLFDDLEKSAYALLRYLQEFQP